MSGLAAEVRERLPPPPVRERWPSVTVVVPTHDGLPLLQVLLGGLDGCTEYPRLDVVVVDNASSDGTLEWLEREPFPFPFPLSVVGNVRNLSFAAACNRGAAAGRGSLLLFVNNDVEPIEHGWLKRLVTALDESGAAAAGALLADPATNALQHRDLVPRFLDDGELRTDLRGLGDPVASAIGPDRPAAAVAAACMLVRRPLFESLGGFCELFLYGGEDIDFCFRLAERGHGVVTAGQAVLLHRPLSTRRAAFKGRRELLRSNHRLLLERWGPRLRREHALDAAEGRGVWSLAPHGAADAGLSYCVKGEPAAAEALAAQLRRMGRSARAGEGGYAWLADDVVVHLRERPWRPVLVPGRRNVLAELREPMAGRERFDLVLDGPADAAALAAAVEERFSPERILPAPAPRRAVIVLGMARTGTSAVTRLLELLGVELGGEDRLLGPIEGINPKGFYEHYAIMRLNTALLARLGGTWKAPPELPDGWAGDPALDDLREEARRLLEESFAGAALWGFKDPRTCLTLPFWRPLIGEASFVVCHRNPLDVAASIERRDGIAVREGVNLWTRYSAAAVAATVGEHRMFTSYDECFRPDLPLLAGLAAFTGRPARAEDPVLRERALDWLEGGLRHHHHDTRAVLDSPAVDDDARELHLLLEVAVRDRDPADGALDALSRRLLPTAPGAPAGSLRERVEAFPVWHYAFELGEGVRTVPRNPEGVNRHAQRRRYFFEPMVQRLGGSLRGRRVLDLGCNAGFWSLLAAEAGADHVLGIDGRATHVEQAKLVLEAKGIDRGRFDFRVADVLTADLSQEAPFDVVLCLGLLYHVADPVGLFAQLERWTRELLVLDSTVAAGEGAWLELRRESVEDARNALASEQVLRPTRDAVVALAASAGFEAVELEPAFTDYAGAADYRDGLRRAWLCSVRP